MNFHETLPDKNVGIRWGSVQSLEVGPQVPRNWSNHSFIVDKHFAHWNKSLNSQRNSDTSQPSTQTVLNTFGCSWKTDIRHRDIAHSQHRMSVIWLCHLWFTWKQDKMPPGSGVGPAGRTLAPHSRECAQQQVWHMSCHENVCKLFALFCFCFSLEMSSF